MGMGESTGMSARIAATACPETPNILTRMDDRVANAIADAVLELTDCCLTGPQARAVVQAHVARPLAATLDPAALAEPQAG